MTRNSSTTILEKFISLAGVSAFCFAVIYFSPITFFSRLVGYDFSYYFLAFERHFWQYLFSFIAVIVLSRGHLWSYGINSQNLKRSMKLLVILYLAVIVSVIIVGNALLPVEREHLPSGNSEIILSMLVYWMSSPVANQILFFSFAQTVLMKQWGSSAIAGIPIAVFISSLLFTFGATSSGFVIGEYSFVPTFLLGLFCALAYWKTNSLITPMLGHAFYFGFPLFIHLVRTNGFQ